MAKHSRKRQPGGQASGQASGQAHSAYAALPLAESDSTRTLLWRAAAMVVLIVAAYSSSIPGGFLWDDDAYVVNNATLRDFDGLRRIWFEPRATPQYYPLVHTSFWIEYQLWELWAPGYRFVNVLIHAAAALLLWRVLRNLDVPLAWLIASVFALHPVHVESVAWVTERKNTLSALFILAFAWLFLPLLLDDTPRPWRSVAARCAVSVGLFVAALLSKTVVVTAPAAALVIVWWKRGRLTWRDVRLTLPLFLIAVPFGLLTVWLERDFVGATGDEWNFSFADRWLIAGRALWFYAGKLVAPFELSFIYPRWTIDDGQPWQYVFPVAAWGVIGLSWQRRRAWGRGPLAGVLYFAGTLFPALGFFNVYPMRYSFVADHFQYLASLGPIVLIVAGLGRASDWLSRRYPDRVSRVTPLVCAALALGSLAILTWNRGVAFSDLETLWCDTIQRNPSSVMAHANLGSLLRDQGRLAEAREEFARAIEIDPNQAPPHNLLGTIQMAEGDAAGARRSFERALERDTRYADARSNLGVALDALGETQAALAALAEAVALEPENAICRYNWASILHKHGRLEDAAAQYREAMRINPQFAEAQHNLNALLGAADGTR